MAGMSDSSVYWWKRRDTVVKERNIKCNAVAEEICKRATECSCFGRLSCSYTGAVDFSMFSVFRVSPFLPPDVMSCFVH